MDDFFMNDDDNAATTTEVNTTADTTNDTGAIALGDNTNQDYFAGMDVPSNDGGGDTNNTEENANVDPANDATEEKGGNDEPTFLRYVLVIYFLLIIVKSHIANHYCLIIDVIHYCDKFVK